jgi:hypothetical protein
LTGLWYEVFIEQVGNSAKPANRCPTEKHPVTKPTTGMAVHVTFVLLIDIGYFSSGSIHSLVPILGWVGCLSGGEAKIDIEWVGFRRLRIGKAQGFLLPCGSTWTFARSMPDVDRCHE